MSSKSDTFVIKKISVLKFRQMAAFSSDIVQKQGIEKPV
jgi:hypothetical protein